VPSSIALGPPLWCDGPSLDAGLPFRCYDVATRVYSAGTSTAVAVPGGVYPGIGAMGVSSSSGLNVQVAAGYCCVPHPTAGQGGYIFGTLQAQNLSLAAADPVNPRIDLIVARVYDTGDSASYCDVEVVSGTAATPPAQPSAPSAAIALASVYVPAASVALASGAVTDLRTYVVAPGGILPIANSAAAPAAPATQVMYDMSRNLLVQGTGTAGTTALLNTGAWTPALSYVSHSVSDSSSRGSLTQVTSVSVTVDGSTDLEIYYKWPGLYAGSAPLLVTMSVAIDGTVLDQTPVYVQSSSSSSPANGGSARYYTEAANATTPSAGTHTITFSFQSASTGTTTTMACSSAPALACLRVSPAVA
jgi:hypothetical protein